jgi:hypothetical protein
MHFISYLFHFVTLWETAKRTRRNRESSSVLWVVVWAFHICKGEQAISSPSSARQSLSTTLTIHQFCPFFHPLTHPPSPRQTHLSILIPPLSPSPCRLLHQPVIAPRMLALSPREADGLSSLRASSTRTECFVSNPLRNDLVPLF